MIVSRNLEHLSPEAFTIAKDMLKGNAWLQKNGIQILITCTYRDSEAQAHCYAQGRTEAQLRAVGIMLPPRKGGIITRALPGQSAHNRLDANGKAAADAVDIVPLRLGKAVWGLKGNGLDEDQSDDMTDDLEAWHRIAECGVHAGFQWYGAPGSPFKEFPHFQYRRKK